MSYSSYPSHHPQTARASQSAAAVSRHVQRASHDYTLTHHGRQVRIGPVAFWIVVGTLVVMAVWSIATGTYFAFREDVLTRLIGRQADMQFAYEDRIADLRVKQGVDLPDEAQKARAQLAAVREMRVALEGSAKIRRVSLASLLGVAPEQLPELQPRPLPRVDEGIPANAALDLIARRPDIAASRWQVEAALRQTDAARAEFFPDFSVSAMAGLSSIDMGKLFTAGSRTFALTPELHLPIFSGGALKANYGVSKAQLDAAIAQYDSTVLAAAREVATQALGAQQIAARRTVQRTRVEAQGQLLANAQARATQGVRDARESLGAKAQWLQQRDSAVQLQAQAVATDLALVKALGGGYRDASTADRNADSTSSVTAGARP